MISEFLSYIQINEDAGWALTSGINFSTFLAALPPKTGHLLILSGLLPWVGARFNAHTRCSYLTPEALNEFPFENLRHWGDFCWVDFSSEAQLDRLPDQTLAEMLFAGYEFRPMRRPFWQALGNQCLYLSHDDGFFARVYLKNIRDYRRVIVQRINELFMGRKKALAPMPEPLALALYELCRRGVILDAERLSFQGGRTGLSLYPCLEEPKDFDRLYSVLEGLRKRAANIWTLSYCRQKWTLRPLD